MLTDHELSALLHTLQARFEGNTLRHPNLSWEAVRARLEAQPDKCWSLYQMELTGGEPDVTGFDPTTGEVVFCDCSAESPAGRRSLCYDRAGLLSRREAPPADTALEMAARMGVRLLTEAEYFELQRLGEFDTKTSSWLLTPDEVRHRGGALFGDRRYGRTFVYHNGAGSYYGVRGFRALLRI